MPYGVLLKSNKKLSETVPGKFKFEFVDKFARKLHDLTRQL